VDFSLKVNYASLILNPPPSGLSGSSRTKYSLEPNNNRQNLHAILKYCMSKVVSDYQFDGEITIYDTLNYVIGYQWRYWSLWEFLNEFEINVKKKQAEKKHMHEYIWSRIAVVWHEESFADLWVKMCSEIENALQTGHLITFSYSRHSVRLKELEQNNFKSSKGLPGSKLASFWYIYGGITLRGGSGGILPLKMFELQNVCGAIWRILRHKKVRAGVMH